MGITHFMAFINILTRKRDTLPLFESQYPELFHSTIILLQSIGILTTLTLNSLSLVMLYSAIMKYYPLRSGFLKNMINPLDTILK